MLPENQGTIPLGELADITVGHVGPMASEYVAAGIPFLRSQNVKPFRIDLDDVKYIGDEFHGRLSKSTLRPGDVVVVRTGTPGTAAVIPDTLPISNCSDLVIIRPKDQVDSWYLSYFINGAAAGFVSSRLVGAVQQHFNVGSARELRIPNLTLFEQRCIASVLCAIDDKIEANEQSLRIVDQLLRTQFQILAAAALAHVSDGDPLPRGWRHTNLASVLDVLETGSRPKGGVSAYSSGVPSLGAESVLGLARYNYSKTKYVPIEFFDKMRRGISQDLDVLLYKDGGRPGEFEPHVALLGQGFPFAMFCINEHVYRLRGTEGVSQEFLYCWLSSEPILEEMRRRGTGVAIPGLNSSAVKGLPIELPSTEEIERFTKVARPLVSFALKSALESQALAAMRDGLLPGLLSGVIRVREEELNLGGVV